MSRHDDEENYSCPTCGSINTEPTRDSDVENYGDDEFYEYDAVCVDCGQLFDYDETKEATQALDEKEATYISNILSHFENEDGFGNALLRLAQGFFLEFNTETMKFQSVNDERGVTTPLGLHEVTVLLKTLGITLPKM